MSLNFSEDFKFCSTEKVTQIQKQARRLYALFAVSLIASPVLPSFVMRKGNHSVLAMGVGLAFVIIAFYAQYRRAQLMRQLTCEYDKLPVGAKLYKKAPTASSKQFLIIDKNTRQFSLQCLHTGRSIVVCKHRVREDFDIAN